uniref:Transposase n=1 Tax=Acrobeloides nanus TaxID=290746 RepID=A0A914DNV6_9BILA
MEKEYVKLRGFLKLTVDSISNNQEIRRNRKQRAHLIPWANNAFSDDEWTFQQDGAPGHKAIEAQNFIHANCPEFISVDTHWRNNDEEKACAKRHPNVESLKRALKKAWNEITLETLIKIVDNFPKRLKACMDAKGGHFE